MCCFCVWQLREEVHLSVVLTVDTALKLAGFEARYVSATSFIAVHVHTVVDSEIRWNDRSRRPTAVNSA